MAKAAKTTIVEAENIVEVGDIHPDAVDLPGIFVDRIVPATAEKKIEMLKVREPENAEAKKGGASNEHQVKRERIGKRASQELQEGYYVNLGVGKLLHEKIKQISANW
jgi:3-oxoacid CoA-transferase